MCKNESVRKIKKNPKKKEVKNCERKRFKEIEEGKPEKIKKLLNK